MRRLGLHQLEGSESSTPPNDGDVPIFDAATNRYVPGAPSGGGVQSIVAGTGIAVDDTDPANPVVSATGGGGGGGLAQSYLGKNAIGANWLAITTNGTFKKITTGAKAAVLLSVEAYLRQGTVDQVGAVGAALYTDNAGTPDRVLSYTANGANSTSGDAVILDKSSSDLAPSSTPRWFGIPISYLLAANTSYWIGIHHPDLGSFQIAYDNGGTDRTYTGANWISDWGRYIAATTTRDHSLRFSVLS